MKDNFNYITYLKEELKSREHFNDILKNHIEEMEKIPYKEGDVVFCLSKKKAVIVKDFNSDIRSNDPKLTVSIVSVHEDERVLPEDLIPYDEATHILYGLTNART